MTYYLILASCGLWPLLAKLIFGREYSGKELVTHIGAGLLIAVLGWNFGIYNRTSRVELLNGEVTGKDYETVSCSHSYECRCKMVTVGTGKDARKERQCDTCYRHDHDYDWWIRTNVGRDIEIPRIDEQGYHEPPRWQAAAKGQPVAREHDYTNYVAAQNSSLFHKQVEDMAELPDVPKYPRVFDYQYANRVLPVGITLPELPQWQMDLANALKELGPQKQANITVVIANTPAQNYRHKVEAAWEGGSKNDIVVVIGVQEDLKILWADVITFAGNIGNEALQVDLRNALLDLGTVERVSVLSTITQHVRAQFTRPQMKDFEYLGRDLEPETWYQIMFTVVYIFLTLCITVYFRRVDFLSSTPEGVR